MKWKLPDWAHLPLAADARPSWAAVARRAPRWLALAPLVFLLAALAFMLVMLPLAPGVKELRALQAAQPSVLMSADGQPLMRFTRAQQERVPLAQISPHVLHALLATEDQRFYTHHGVDLYRTAGALWHTLTGETQGGSTITQQLARNLFPDEIGRSRTLARKAKEIITALRIEATYDKDQILETYLNSAPFLYNVVGIEMAARTYYDKSAAELDVLESATLIGMLKGTRYYNPVLHPERAKERRNVVLAQMVRQRLLPRARYEALREQPLGVQLTRQPDVFGQAPHFAMQLRKWLIAWADEHDYNLYTDGLIVQTTIDSRLQQAATQAVERQAQVLQAIADVEWSAPGLRLVSTSPEAYAAQRPRVDPFGHFWAQHRELLTLFLRETPQFKAALQKQGSEAAALQTLLADSALMARLRRDKTRLEAGFLAMDPASGEVRAWVGSRDFDTDQFDHVSLAQRQPGSTFKPFVYGAALEAGFSPERSYVDTPIELHLGDGAVWRPTDMASASGEPMTLRDGLVYSKNTITAQVAQDVGVRPIVALAQALGVDQSRLHPVPSLALGTSPVTLLEMVTAYSTIAQQGTYHRPVLVRRISDRRGTVLAEFGSQTRRAMSADAASDLIDMMRGVVQRGTGTQIKTRFGIVGDIAGKTGTTQNNTDGWFILMHPTLVAGAWVGFNDSRVTMRSDYWGQGGHNAIRLVGDFFKSALKSGLIDTHASFPPPRHPPGPGASWPSDPGSLDNAQQNEPENDPPKSAAELERILQGMGRDPATGEPRNSGTAPNGTGSNEPLNSLPPPSQ